MKKQTAAEHDVMVEGAREVQFQTLVSLKPENKNKK